MAEENPTQDKDSLPKDGEEAKSDKNEDKNNKLVSQFQLYILQQNKRFLEKLSQQANSASLDFDVFKRWAYQDLQKHHFQLKEAGKNLIFKDQLSIDALTPTESQEPCCISNYSKNNEASTIIVLFARDCQQKIIDELSQLLSTNFPLIDIEHKKHHFNHFTEAALYLTPKDAFFDQYFIQTSMNQPHAAYELSAFQKSSFFYNILMEWKLSNLQVDRFQKEYPTLFENLQDDNGSIFETLLKGGVLSQIYQIHDEKRLSRLKNRWIFQFYRSQPLNDICEYFGLEIAIYFSFIGFYTKWLSFPMFFGLFVSYFTTIIENIHSNILSNFYPQLLFDLWHYLFSDFDLFSEDNKNDILLFTFTIFNMFWSTIMLQKWKERCSFNVQNWDRFMPISYSGIQLEEQGENTTQKERHRKRNMYFKCFMTFPIIAFCLVLTFSVMFQIFHFQFWIDIELIQNQNYQKWIRFLPKIMLAFVISLSNFLYYYIAVILNEREGHLSKKDKENSLILKLFFYQFLNNFLPLFYLAFYIQDMDKLKEQLAAQLITRQIIGNFNEAILPLIKELYRIATRTLTNISGENEKQQIPLSRPELESFKFRYESTFEDYLELIIQFGYVMLFAPVFPLAAFYALMNNLLEIRSDAFKLCYVYQRPFSVERCDSIGQWENILYSLTIIAITNNCALMVVTGQISRVFGFVESSHIILTGVAIEHGLMIMKWLIPNLI